MAILAAIINLAGLVLLTHAIYSAHEHTSRHASSATAAAPAAAALPTDIAAELLAATALLMAGIVLASAPLRPIRWAAWAGENERTKISEASRERGVFGNPFEGLEYRTGFVDVRARRREFEGWVRGR